MSYTGAGEENWSDSQGWLAPGNIDHNPYPPGSLTPDFILTTPTGQGQVDRGHEDLIPNTGPTDNQPDWPNDEANTWPFSSTDAPSLDRQQHDESWPNAQASGSQPFPLTYSQPFPQPQRDEGWTYTQAPGYQPFASTDNSFLAQQQQYQHPSDPINAQASGSQLFPSPSAGSAMSSQRSSGQELQAQAGSQYSADQTRIYLHPHVNSNFQEAYTVGPSIHAGSNYLRNLVGLDGRGLRATETPRHTLATLQEREPRRAKSVMAASHRESPRYQPYPSVISNSFEVLSSEILSHSESGQTPRSSQSGSTYSPSAVHSAPGESTPTQFISVQPNRDEEIDDVASEFLCIVNYEGPLTTGTQSYGTKSIAAVHEAHSVVYNRGTTTLPKDLDDELIGLILSAAGRIVGRLTTYVRKRFPTDWKINPPPSKGYAVGSKEYKEYQVTQINNYTNELNFTKSEVGTPARDNDYPLFNHPSLYDGFADCQWSDRLLGLARPDVYRRSPPYHLLALYIAIILHRFHCELAVIQGNKPKGFGEEYDYVSTLVLSQINQITSDDNKKAAFLEYFHKWAVEGHARFIRRGKRVKKNTRRAPPRVQITAGVNMSALP